ncbi:hypothetical protein FH972_005771 [Carpinus fangiana]|uniref:pectinesterase n=1 Tax=Carpinus fangiana TaxID=176857 RepID=A0A5N6QQ95_9ROSI|nr:hypothetical protein FH972_005771 [Carpinus fangiana]
MLLLTYFTICRAFDCEVNYGNKKVAGSSIYVSKAGPAGRGNFKTIQRAIDSIPPSNSQWIHIRISPGIYHEKVIIPQEKPCIFIEGAGTNLTSVEWDDHEDTTDSPTFTSFADNIIVKGITFKNTYNHPMDSLDNLTQAAAARIVGDKSVFSHCAFVGVQDTLWDDHGRHYFHKCYIQGGVDFIFGNGRSIYERSIIKYSIGDFGANRSYGYITANGRASADDPSGFVFNRCAVIGSGKVYLGRAWKTFSRVIFVNSLLSEVVEPEGWWAWDNVGHEANITYVEANNVGAGADTSKRVPWEKKLSAAKLSKFMKTSFIDKEGWIEKLPIAL